MTAAPVMSAADFLRTLNDAIHAEGDKSNEAVNTLCKFYAEISAEVARLKEMTDFPGRGHNASCAVCGEGCDNLAGNSMRWPSLVGNQRYAHVGCLHRLIEEVARLREAAEWRPIESAPEETYVVFYAPGVPDAEYEQDTRAVIRTDRRSGKRGYYERPLNPYTHWKPLSLEEER